MADVTASPPPPCTDAELARRQVASAELLDIARPHLEWLSATYARIAHAAFLVDRDGIVLHAMGAGAEATGATGATGAAEVLPGHDWSEGSRGRNGAGAALVAGGPVIVAGSEHHEPALHESASMGAPVRGVDGAVLGALALRTTASGASERLAVVAHAAFAVERELRARDALRRTSGHLDAERRRAEARYEHIAANVPGMEERVLLPTGEERFVEVAARDQRLPDGRVVTDGVVIDVTERKHAEWAMRESAEQYRRLVELSPDGIIIHRDRRIIYVNPVAARLVGAPGPEALIGRVGLDFIHPDEHARIAERMRAIAGGEATTPVVEQRWIRFDGSVMEVEVQPLAFVHEGKPAVQTVFRDIGARKALEEQLRQAQKMEAVGQLAGGVAHDFNNLLTVIKVHAELARDEVDPQHPLAADLEEIRKATARAADLTRQLLAFSRKQILAPRALDLNAVVAGLEPMLRRLIGEDIAVRTRLTPGLGPVLADPGQLEQVLVNLAVNARDAMPHGGTLIIATANHESCTSDLQCLAAGVMLGSCVTLTVTDTGAGMSPEVQARIFEPFFTTKPTGKGTGLGLSTVYGIVEQSGGRIDVASAPGRGTAFTIYLPRVPAAGAPLASSPACAARPRGTETVLLVEDEDAVRRLARRILEEQGYAVLEARDGHDALAVVASHDGPLDLVLTDVVMPRMNGRALVEQLLAARPALRVLYMSGYTDDEIIRRGLHRAGTSFLQKPFTADGLAEAVRAALEGERAGLA
ncbi:MAG TPA: ATP-binding protein [Gemmatimonadaceae bacterium]